MTQTNLDSALRGSWEFSRHKVIAVVLAIGWVVYIVVAVPVLCVWQGVMWIGRMLSGRS